MKTLKYTIMIKILPQKKEVFKSTKRNIRIITPSFLLFPQTYMHAHTLSPYIYISIYSIGNFDSKQFYSPFST